MNPLLRFRHMLSNYRSFFKYNNYDHFRTFVCGLITKPQNPFFQFLSLSWTMRYLLTPLITCSTRMRIDAIFLLVSFSLSVRSPPFGFFLGINLVLNVRASDTPFAPLGL